MPRPFALSAAVVFATTTAAFADYQHCAMLHDRMPNSLGDLVRFDRGSYPERALGFSDQYEIGGRALVSVFLYDFDDPQITPQDVLAQYQGALQDMERVAAKNGVQDWAVTSELTVNESGVFSHAVLASSRDDRGVLQDALAVGQSGPCFVKIRLTLIGDGDQALDLLGQAAGGVEQALDP